MGVSGIQDNSGYNVPWECYRLAVRQTADSKADVSLLPFKVTNHDVITDVITVITCNNM